MERLGVVKPHYDSAAAKKSWEDYKRLRGMPASDREEEGDRGRRLKEYLLTIALEECMKRDMPMQIHSGDGEAPGVILRRQNPYILEEVVRFDRDGVMRMPKLIPIHGRYPLVGQAVWFKSSIHQLLLRNLSDESHYPPGNRTPLWRDSRSRANVENTLRKRFMVGSRVQLVGRPVWETILEPGIGSLCERRKPHAGRGAGRRADDAI